MNTIRGQKASLHIIICIFIHPKAAKIKKEEQETLKVKSISNSYIGAAMHEALSTTAIETVKLIQHMSKTINVGSALLIEHFLVGIRRLVNQSSWSARVVNLICTATPVHSMILESVRLTAP
jgi:hypothetical protein